MNFKTFKMIKTLILIFVWFFLFSKDPFEFYYCYRCRTSLLNILWGGHHLLHTHNGNNEICMHFLSLLLRNKKDILTITNKKEMAFEPQNVLYHQYSMAIYDTYHGYSSLLSIHKWLFTAMSHHDIYYNEDRWGDINSHILDSRMPDYS